MRHVFRTQIGENRQNTAILMVWGADDPSPRWAKVRTAARLQKLGLATAQIRIPQLRHEILNRANRAQVFDDIVRLIQA